MAPAEDLSLNGWNAVINIVLNGTWNCTHTVGNEWIKNGERGHIINMLAPYVYVAAPGFVHSASAKGGVLSMSRTLASEWGSRYGIRVNCISPGAISQTGGQQLTPEDAEKENLSYVPLQRYGSVEEIANLAFFMLSHEAEYLNGECISLDGGATLHEERYIDMLNTHFPVNKSGN